MYMHTSYTCVLALAYVYMYMSARLCTHLDDVVVEQDGAGLEQLRNDDDVLNALNLVLWHQLLLGVHDLRTQNHVNCANN